MSPTKKILIGLGVLVVLLIPVAVLAGGGEEGIEVETAEVKVRAITESITASGTVAAEVEVPISSDVSGEVVQLAVEEGQVVEQGQLLLRVRPDFYASQQEQAQAQVASASAGVSQARRDVVQAQADAAQATADRERTERTLERQQDLFDRGVISEAELDAAKGAAQVSRASEQAALARISTIEGRIQSAQVQVRSAQSQARQASQQLAQTAIRAPMSGTVIGLVIEPGERVVGTAQMSGTEVMRIARLDAMTMEVDVNENDVVRIAVGDSVRIEIDAYPDEPLTGMVTEIANSARVNAAGTAQAVTNFPVEIRINADSFMDAQSASGASASSSDEGVAPRQSVQLRPGMSGTVDVFARTVPNAVVVPIQAVTVRDFNELAREERDRKRALGEEVSDEEIPEEEDLRRVVFVMVDGKAELREVETGIADETHIEIRSGLAGGETVVTGPFQLLRAELKPDDSIQESDDE
ncbi:MAG: efflux RND transporter periplasmic adaptor subunit [Rubricoccaceae bacterium]